jgi:hypothetical protein
MRLSTFSTALALSLLSACTILAQQSEDARDEFAVSVGALSGGNPSVTSAAGPLSLGSGLALEANYAHKYRELKWGAIYWELNVLGDPFRHLSGFPVTATSEIRSLYATPGVRLQFAPQDRITPWLAAGGGYAFYDSSNVSLTGGTTGGGVSSTSGTVNTYAVDFGAGVDIVASKRYIVRGDVRGFYTGSPNYGVSTTSGLFVFAISGGIVWRFSK